MTPTSEEAMTAPDLSPAEAATVERFDAAEPAPESYFDYTVEVGGQKFTRAQWEAVQVYAAGTSATARPVGDGDGHDELRGLLLHHHPIMRSEDGPFSDCRCGSVRLGQDVIRHVMTELEPWAERVARERAAEELRAAAEEASRYYQAGTVRGRLLARADALDVRVNKHAGNSTVLAQIARSTPAALRALVAEVRKP